MKCSGRAKLRVNEDSMTCELQTRRRPQQIAGYREILRQMVGVISGDYF
jgi:hypothetical protein